MKALHRRGLLNALVGAVVPGSALAAPGCFAAAEPWNPFLPTSVTNSVVRVVAFRDGIGEIARATGFLLSRSAAGTALGLNRVVTAAHVVCGADWVLISSSWNRILGRCAVEAADAETDVAALDFRTVPLDGAEVRGIGGLSLGQQRWVSGASASPSGPYAGASGAPLLDGYDRVRAVLVRAAVDVSSGKVRVRALPPGGSDLRDFLMPQRSRVWASPIPPSLLELFGLENTMRRTALSHFRIPTIGGGACVVHSGAVVR